MASRRNSTHMRGFTLIEILMAVAVMVALSGYALFNFNQILSNLTIRRSAEDFFRLAQYAQEKAVLEREPVKIEINFSEKYYRLLQKTSGQNFNPVSGQAGETVAFPGRAEFIGEDSKGVLCFPDGGCRPYVLEVRGDTRAIYEISISKNSLDITFREIPF